jgi:hypothetical protein
MHWLKQITNGGKSSAYYILTLKKDKGRTSFAGAFVEDLIAKTTLLDDVVEYRQFLKSQITKYREEQNLGAKVSDDEVIEKIIPAAELYNFAKELDKQDDTGKVRDFLIPKGLTDYQAMVTFTRIANLFVYELRFKNATKRFRQSVHLMIDELDVLRQSSTKEILEVNDLIRHLYDLCPNCFGLVLAVSAEQELLSSIFAEPILTRVNRQIEFKPLDRESSVEFATQIMDAMRLDKADRGKTGAFPFTDAALDAILGELTFRTPRKVVNAMQQVIEEVRLAGLNPADGPVDVDVLDKTGLLDEVL